MGRYVLGLDLGSSSIGWAVVKINEDGDFGGLATLKDGPNDVPAIGARIFPAGVERYGQGKREQTRNKTRREKRGMRRTLRRRRTRYKKLVALLQANNILPKNDTELQKLQQEADPYELRAKAIKKLEELTETEKPISLTELGRIFLHICKKRGFKSNRKAPPKKEEKGKVNEAKTRFGNFLNGRMPGQAWHEEVQEKNRKQKHNPSEAIKNKGGTFQFIATSEQYKE